MKFRIYTLLVLMFYALVGFTQPKPYGLQPEVGKPMPDFKLDNITHYKTTKASLDDFKGKWLFLDFWFTGCITCIQSFPKINAIQQAFLNEVQYMMVGISEKKTFLGGGIEGVYEKIRKKLDLKLASAYDSVLMIRWGIWSMPHIIIVDPDGIVRHITNGSDMTIEKVKKLISVEPVSFKAKDRPVPEYNIETISDSVMDKLVYRSILTKSAGEIPTIPILEDYVTWPVEYRNRGLEVTTADLVSLYKLAYYGHCKWSVAESGEDMLYYPDVVLEVQDTQSFYYNSQIDNYEDLYSYNLTLPGSQSKDLKLLKKAFQNELYNIFGYEATLEKRKMPVWNLVAKPGTAKRLKTRGGNEYIGDGTGSGALPAGFTAVNISTKKLLELIIYYIDYKLPPFFDETEIVHNIDVVINADMTNGNDIRRSLLESGLDLVVGEREFLVLVIRERQVGK